MIIMRKTHKITKIKLTLKQKRAENTKSSFRIYKILKQHCVVN